MKRTLSHSSSFKYVKSILAHLYLLVPFLSFKFPPCKFQCSSAISLYDFFQKPELKFTQSEALSASSKTAWHFEHDSAQSLSLIPLSEIPSCFSGPTSISLDGKYTQTGTGILDFLPFLHFQWPQALYLFSSLFF